MWKVGQKVERRIADTHFMYMIILLIEDGYVYCAARDTLPNPMPDKEFIKKEAWKFDYITGWEEDEDLQWGIKFGRSGTYIIPIKGDK